MSADNKEYQPRCKYLNSKSLAVFGEYYEDDPDFQEGQTEYECMCTARGEGPDGECATLEDCSNPSRSCFREY